MGDVKNGDFTFNYELNVIGWCMRDGIKQLLTDTGFTVAPVMGYVLTDGDEPLVEVDDLIAKCEKEAKEAGIAFPEFVWNGICWQEVRVTDGKETTNSNRETGE